MAGIKPRSYRRQVFRFVVLFALLAAASSALETWMRARRAGTGYQAAIARTVCALVAPLGVEARRLTAANECTIRVNDVHMVVTLECAAVLATGFFVAAVLAFPGRWRIKLVGVVVGVVGVGLLNLLRIMILATVAYYLPQRFSVAHEVFMQGFLLIMVAPLWLGWLGWVMRRSRRARPEKPGPGRAVGRG